MFELKLQKNIKLFSELDIEIASVKFEKKYHNIRKKLGIVTTIKPLCIKNI